MNRKPIVFILMSVFWVVYLALIVVFYNYKMQEVIRESNIKRFSDIEYQLYAAEPLLLQDNVEVLRQNLNLAHERKYFDFYILRKNSSLIDFRYEKASQNEVEELELPLGNFPADRSAQDLPFQVKTIQFNDYKLSVGMFVRDQNYIMRTVYYYRWDFLQEMILVTCFLGLIAYLVLKDVIDLTKILRTKNRGQARLVKVRTKEAETLLAVASQFEAVNEGLKLTNLSFSDSISPAVRHELNEGTRTPHLFDAVVVRVDVNGYTQMFLDKKDEFVTQTLNRYFQQASEIIRRYQGHIYQFVGDEIVFHFKQYEVEDPLTQAMHCVRSLFQVAKELDHDLRPQGVPFVVKSSMAKGRLRFIRLDSGYAFAGLPLIESVRMLGKVDDRHENTLALYASDFDQRDEAGQVARRLPVSFKGFSGQTEIVEIQKFKEVNLVLNAKVWSELKWFRSDQDLAEILRFAVSNMGQLSAHDISEISRELRGFEIEKIGMLVADLVADFISVVDVRVSRLLEKTISEDEPSQALWLRNLASITSLTSHILRAGVFREDLRLILEKNLKHPDQRVRANTILALDELSPETYSFRELFSLPFNRAAADALFVEGRREFSDEVFHFLQSFLESNDPFFIASGIYVLAALYDYHRKTDAVYFKANLHLQRIPNLIQHLASHENAMVKRRAEISLRSLDQSQAA